MLLAPIDPTNIIAVGLNYKKHVAVRCRWLRPARLTCLRTVEKWLLLLPCCRRLGSLPLNGQVRVRVRRWCCVCGLLTRVILVLQ
jgi:hypothetical protein